MEHQRRRGKRQRSHNATAADDNFNFPASLAKRLHRPTPTTATTEDIDVGVHDDDGFKSSSSSSPLVMVTGLPSDCTVLELKSRLEMYGPISRTRIDALDGAGYVTFRSAASAESAIAASLDHAFGVTIRSSKVLVRRAADPLLVWKTGAVATAPSKLLRAEIPLSKHGRSNKKLTAAASTSGRSASEPPYKGREIVAYDDLF